jgi:hypothetical protein
MNGKAISPTIQHIGTQGRPVLQLWMERRRRIGEQKHNYRPDKRDERQQGEGDLETDQINRLPYAIYEPKSQHF